MRRLCVFPNDPLSASARKGEVKAGYFNPCGLFEEVHVMSLTDREVDPEAVQEMAGAARLIIHPLGRVRLEALLRPASYRRRVLEVMRAIQPDVVRAHNPLFAGWLAVSCAKALGTPAVVSLHGNYDEDIRRLFWLEGRLLHWAKYSLFGVTTEPYVLRGADAVICAYEFPAVYAKRHGARRVTVIYNRVDLERFTPPSSRPADGPMTVLAVGRLDPEKNHACLIRAMAGLSGVRLRLLGDGVERARLRRLAEHLGVSDRVAFIPSVPHREVHREYQRADVFASATRYGGIHIPVLEAMACGLPLIVPVPRWERAPELVGDVALVVENQPEAFRRAFATLRDDPALRAQLGALAHQRLIPFGGAVMEAREAQVYRELLGERVTDEVDREAAIRHA